MWNLLRVMNAMESAHDRRPPIWVMGGGQNDMPIAATSTRDTVVLAAVSRGADWAEGAKDPSGPGAALEAGVVGGSTVTFRSMTWVQGWGVWVHGGLGVRGADSGRHPDRHRAWPVRAHTR